MGILLNYCVTVPTKKCEFQLRCIEFNVPRLARGSREGLATREAFDEAFRGDELLPPDADLPTAPASDVPTPSTVTEVDSSEHAAIWRNFRTREFRGLLQANTFGPA